MADHQIDHLGFATLLKTWSSLAPLLRRAHRQKQKEISAFNLANDALKFAVCLLVKGKLKDNLGTP